MIAPARQRLRAMRLYALISERHCRLPWLRTAELLLEAGVDALQLREKDLSDAELLARARALRQVAARHGALFIVNDRPDVALLSEADGVHLGQDDLPVPDARRLLGPDAIIGLSTHTPQQAAAAESLGADYAGVGPVFATATKGYERGGGLELVARLCEATGLPTVAIGGITPDNVERVLAAGARAVAACAALCAVADPAEAARAFLKAFPHEGPGATQ